ncbi:MAG: 16S rRNA (adenine(1518)-N(6)/adenine(1519)-N(6))-dimethyltransferase RsmA [Eubacteriales bacterium]|nr:16S rRNA (adenine(1518)-N(6)/adenine(1519)-N(6))-dimethyltransferase RsmA [Eubacteriales bacterium]
MLRRASREYVLEQRLRPNKALGQNFFIDAPRLIASLDNLDFSQRPVLEIGAGLGGLTELLLERTSTVMAIELDGELAKRLENETKAEVICADAQKLNTDFITQEWFIAGNLPYYITTPLVEKYLLTPARNHLYMVQQEAGERFFAKPSNKNYGVIAIITSLFFDAQTLDTLPPSCYYPEPPITSSLIYLHRKGDIPAGFVSFIKTCLRMRRKTLHNNLKGMDGAEAAFRELNISPSIRAEALTPQQFLALFKSI